MTNKKPAVDQFIFRGSPDDPRVREGHDLRASLFRACEGSSMGTVYETVLNLMLVMIRSAKAEMKADLITSVRQALDMVASETPEDAGGVH